MNAACRSVKGVESHYDPARLQGICSTCARTTAMGTRAYVATLFDVIWSPDRGSTGPLLIGDPALFGMGLEFSRSTSCLLEHCIDLPILASARWKNIRGWTTAPGSKMQNQGYWPRFPVVHNLTSLSLEHRGAPCFRHSEGLLQARRIPSSSGTGT